MPIYSYIALKQGKEIIYHEPLEEEKISKKKTKTSKSKTDKKENTTKTTGLYITKIKFKEGKAIINYRDEQDLSLKEGFFAMR